MKQLNEKAQKILNISLTAIFAVAVVLFIITFSIGLPIYCRFFYFMQIEGLNIPADTGKTVAEIKEAYNQMMDYLTLPNTTFATGVFRFSEEGASHFADCKGLFTLNTTTLIISTVILVATLTLSKLKLVALCRPKGLSIAFYSAISIFVIGIILGGIVAKDFDKAFTVFHKIFFPDSLEISNIYKRYREKQGCAMFASIHDTLSIDACLA